MWRRDIIKNYGIGVSGQVVGLLFVRKGLLYSVVTCPTHKHVTRLDCVLNLDLGGFLER